MTPIILNAPLIDLSGDQARDFILTSLCGVRVVFRTAAEAVLNPDLTAETALAFHYLCRGAMLTIGDHDLEEQLSELATEFAMLAYPTHKVPL